MAAQRGPNEGRGGRRRRRTSACDHGYENQRRNEGDEAIAESLRLGHHDYLLRTTWNLTGGIEQKCMVRPGPESDLKCPGSVQPAGHRRPKRPRSLSQREGGSVAGSVGPRSK